MTVVQFPGAAASLRPCPGQHRISCGGALVGLCLLCQRYWAGQGKPIEPAAVIGPGGVWHCDNEVPAS